MRPNRSDKTVIIPTRLANGSFEYFYGGALPRLTDGVVFDMVVPEWAIEDKSFLNVLQRHHYEVLLPDSAVIYCAVSSDQVPDNLNELIVTLHSITNGNDPHIASVFPAKVFVPIILKDRLELELRGTKLGRLKAAKCAIPSLDKEARSLNHAYRLISEAFEPDRISHSGNVFEEMLYVDSAGQGFPLDELRSMLEAKNENVLRRSTAQ
jgi:hypothetical protein